MHAQISFEYMAIVALALAILIPLSFFVFNHSETQTRSKQAEIAVNSLTTAADSLYAQGRGAKTTLQIFLPDGYDYQKSFISNRTISIKVNTANGAFDVVGKTRGNVSGTLPSRSGYKDFVLEMWENYVLINERPT